MLREATWSRVGTDVTGAQSIQEVLQKSGLDYEVVKTPLFLDNGYQVPGRFAIKKADEDKVFGIVGSDYTICQNSDAFEFVNLIGEGLEFVKAGQTYHGLVYIIARLPEEYIMDDKVQPYVIFQNGHTGFTPVKAAIAPLRIVCQNQFSMAFKNAKASITISHTKSLEDKMKNARKVLITAADYMNNFKNQAEELYKKKLSKDAIDDLIEELFPEPETPSKRQIEAVEEKRNRFFAAYNDEDNLNFRGTAWGLVNAYSDYLTHLEPARKTENWADNKFVQVTLNPAQMHSFVERVKAL